MHLFRTVLCGFIASFWVFYGLHIAYGALRCRSSKTCTCGRPDCPNISILFAARDEQEKLAAALATLMEIEYPHFEVVAVDDRSSDATGQILDDFAALHPRLRVVHVVALPAGLARQAACTPKSLRGCHWRVAGFYRCGCRFKPDVLRRAVTLAKRQNLDHLSLLCDVEMWDSGRKR